MCKVYEALILELKFEILVKVSVRRGNIQAQIKTKYTANSTALSDQVNIYKLSHWAKFEQKEHFSKFNYSLSWGPATCLMFPATDWLNWAKTPDRENMLKYEDDQCELFLKTVCT